VQGQTGTLKAMNKTPEKPEARPSVLKILAYKPGESSIEGKSEAIKMASNESPLGPSPKAVEAVGAALGHLELYPGCTGALKAAIGEAHGLDPKSIMCGSGSEQLIRLVAQAYADAGDEIIQSEFGFLLYRIATLAAGADLVVAKEQDFTTDVDAILAAVSERTRIVFLANPNNPTGTMIAADELRRLRLGLPGRVLLVIDAAYAEYVEDPTYSEGIDLVDESVAAGVDNVVVLRTFSKIYGLAAMRLGWCYGPLAVIAALNRVRGVFDVSILSQVAGIAAVGDQEHITRARRHNSKWLPKLTAELSALGLEVLPSAGNFVLARFPGGADESVAADSYLRDNGIIVRAMAGYGLPEALRITIGTDEQNSALLEVLQGFRSSLK
jgi:histidinol-phosphate aminotransferase